MERHVGIISLIEVILEAIQESVGHKLHKSALKLPIGWTDKSCSKKKDGQIK